ncbi:MAG: lipopolysaccharide kinase InaA family protein [Halioglobus sp.]
MAQDYLPPGWQRRQTSPFTQVDSNESDKLYFKLYRPISPLASLRNKLRGSPALRSIKNGKALAYAGFSAPEIIHSGTVAGIGEFVFTKRIEADSLAACLTVSTLEPSTLRKKRQLLQAVGITLGRLHNSGFVHSKLAADNILVSDADDRFDIILMNNEDMIRKETPSGRALAKELSRLNISLPASVSRTDRLRLFGAWRRQMRSLEDVEAAILTREIYTRRLP